MRGAAKRGPPPSGVRELFARLAVSVLSAEPMLRYRIRTESLLTARASPPQNVRSSLRFLLFRPPTLLSDLVPRSGMVRERPQERPPGASSTLGDRGCFTLGDRSAWEWALLALWAP